MHGRDLETLLFQHTEEENHKKPDSERQYDVRMMNYVKMF